MYHDTDNPKTVHTEQEKENLGPGWHENPADAKKSVESKEPQRDYSGKPEMLKKQEEEEQGKQKQAEAQSKKGGGVK